MSRSVSHLCYTRLSGLSSPGIRSSRSFCSTQIEPDLITHLTSMSRIYVSRFVSGRVSWKKRQMEIIFDLRDSLIDISFRAVCIGIIVPDHSLPSTNPSAHRITQVYPSDWHRAVVFRTCTTIQSKISTTASITVTIQQSPSQRQTNTVGTIHIFQRRRHKHRKLNYCSKYGSCAART